MTTTIVATGIRGKSTFVLWLDLILRERGYSTLAKITGKEPCWISNGEKKLINRKGRGILLDKENCRLLCLEEGEFDFVIVENQGISEYTMRVFYDIAKPYDGSYIGVITNVRLDHEDTMGETEEAIAKSMAMPMKNKIPIIISGDERKEISEIFEAIFYGSKSKFVKIPSFVSFRKEGKLKRRNPLTPLIMLVDKTLKEIGLDNLSEEEAKMLFDISEKALQIRCSNDSVLWFDGSGLNDPDSTERVFRYLEITSRKKFSIVVFLRRDRPARTESFKKWLREISAEPYVKRVILAGYGAEHLAKTLESVVIVEETISPNEVLSFCRDDSVIFLAGNSVNLFMNKFRKHLRE